MSDHQCDASLLTAKSNHGLNVLTACLFIVGEIAGTGILALPEALKSTGWYGVIAIIIVCFTSAFAGILLGKCWLILEKRDASLSTIKTRNAYSLIGYRAFGNTGRLLTATSQTIQLFGGAVVSVLLLAEISQRLMNLLMFHLTFCEWVVISGLIMLPFSFAGSPVDFWPIAISAMSSTAIASVLIVIAVFKQNNSVESFEILAKFEPKNESTVTPRSFFLGLATTVYAFSGASAMPTIQNDMKNKRQFTAAIILAFIILLFVYLPVSIVGYAAFGDTIQSNVMRNLVSSPLVIVTDILIAVHVFSAYLILLNPVNLNIESAFNITHSLNVRRCLSRAIVSALAIFIGLSIPKFGQLLNLVGASAVCLQCFILPCLFYYRLRSDVTLGVFDSQSDQLKTDVPSSPHQKSPQLSLPATNYSSITLNPAASFRATLSIHFKILLILVIISAVALAIIGSYYSLVDLFHPDAFTAPCFICNMDHL